MAFKKDVLSTVRPVLETTSIQQSTALRDHCSDTNPFFYQQNRTCILRPPAVRDHFYYFPWLVSEYRLYCICKCIDLCLLAQVIQANMGL